MHPKTPSVYRSLPNKSGILSSVFKSYRNENTPSLLASGSDSNLSKERIRYLRNRYDGETCYILTCGPSLDAVWSEKLREYLSDRLVIAVKQAFDLMPNMCDFHLYNTVRLKKYSYPGPTTRISVWEYSEMVRSHVHFPLLEDHCWDSAIIRTNEYDKYGDLETRFERPLGTGIMFEVGLFLPVLFGCKRVLVIGFDMNKRGRYHFYRPDDSNSTHYAREGECDHAQDSIPHYLAWAERQGLEVKSYSPLYELCIPQVDDIYSW